MSTQNQPPLLSYSSLKSVSVIVKSILDPLMSTSLQSYSVRGNFFLSDAHSHSIVLYFHSFLS